MALAQSIRIIRAAILTSPYERGLDKLLEILTHIENDPPYLVKRSYAQQGIEVANVLRRNDILAVFALLVNIIDECEVNEVAINKLSMKN